MIVRIYRLKWSIVRENSHFNRFPLILNAFEDVFTRSFTR
jgi:hypothetical protein